MISRVRAYDRIKQVMDFTTALLLLLATLPLQVFVMIAVRIQLGRPVLFRQTRPGKDAELFTLVKFRTMLNSNPSQGLVTNEQRMTPFGRRLRSTSLDELPTLLNVLAGHMSLVGPRPLRVDYLEHYSPEQARRHTVKPGVTGLAQVKGRNSLSWDERLRLDVEYVDTRSLWLDVSILLQTVTTVLRRDGISHPGQATMSKFGVPSAGATEGEAGQGSGNVAR